MSVFRELRMRTSAQGGSGWNASRRARVALVIITTSFLLASVNVTTPLFPTIQQEIGADQLGITIAFCSYVGTLSLVLLVAGHWSDYMGRRALMFIAMILGLAGVLVLAQLNTLAGLILGRGIQGAALGFATGAAATSLRELLPDKLDWAARFSLLSTTGGVAVGPIVGAWLSYVPEHLGIQVGSDSPLAAHRFPYWVSAVTLVLLLIPLLVLKARPAIKANPLTRRSSLRPRKPSVAGEIRARFWLAGTIGVLTYTIFGFTLSLFPAFLIGGTPMDNRVVLAILAVMMIAVSAISQFVPNRSKNVLPVSMLVFTIGTIALPLGVVLGWPAALVLAVTVLACISIGVGQGFGFRKSFNDLSVALPVEKHAQTMSALYLVSYIGSVPPLLVLGWLANEYGLNVAVALFSGLCAAVSLGVALVSLLRSYKGPA